MRQGQGDSGTVSEVCTSSKGEGNQIQRPGLLHAPSSCAVIYAETGDGDVSEAALPEGTMVQGGDVGFHA